jgi:hypothetical protein
MNLCNSGVSPNSDLHEYLGTVLSQSLKPKKRMSQNLGCDDALNFEVYSVHPRQLSPGSQGESVDNTIQKCLGFPRLIESNY